MHYHWRLGVGHLESQQSASTGNSGRVPDVDSYAEEVQLPDLEFPGASEEPSGEAGSDGQSSDMCYEPDNPELGLEDYDLEEWEDTEMDDLDDCGNEDMGDEDELQDLF